MADSEDTFVPLEDETDTRKTAFGPNDYFVAVMGMTGVGKSSFIKHLSGEPVKIGHSLQACTQKVEFFPVECKQDVTVWLLDTPGFDDTNRTDSEVLKEISAHLADPKILYENRKSKLDGIIYMHRITDQRMGGTAQTNLFTFQKLCGQKALTNVILATTMWERVSEQEGIEREEELMRTDHFWGGMIAHGSKVLRHMNTPESALNIIEHFIKTDRSQERPKMVLALQEELVDQELTLDQTGAGQEVDHGLTKAHNGFKARLDELQGHLDSAQELHDEELAAAVMKQRTQLEVEMQQMIQQQKDLNVTVQELYEEKLAGMQQKLEYMEKNPRVRSHPARESFGRWHVSMSLFGATYWFNSLNNNLRSSLPDVPSNCSDEKKGHSNRCIAIGEQNSWYIHYQAHDEQKKIIKRSIFSPNFKSVYPGAYKFLNEDNQNSPPGCISLSTKGHYFARTAAGCDFNLPPSVKDAVGDPASKECLWLGADETWICQWYTLSEDGKQKKYQWDADLKTHYNGMQEALEESERMIRAVALNPTESEQWTILWDDGHTLYRLGEHPSFTMFDYEEWCTKNFGSQWSSSRPQVGQPPEPAELGFFLFARFRRRLKPWKKEWRAHFIPPRRWLRRDSSAAR